MTSTIDSKGILYQEATTEDNKVKKKTYYIPGYLRMKVKNFVSMNLNDLNAEINASLIFTLYYGSLSPEIVKQLESKIVLLFGRDDARALTSHKHLQVTVKNDIIKSQIQFTLRQIFQMRIQEEIFLTPFERINMILTVTIQSITMNLDKKQKYHGITQNQKQMNFWQQKKQKQQVTIRFNLMDCNDRFLKTSYSEEGIYGTYDLAQRKMASFFTNERYCQVEDFYKDRKSKQNQENEIPQNCKKEKYEKKQKQKPKFKIEQFHYGHFIVPVYKYPVDSVVTIFLPLWLLAIINIGIFFQDPSMADRVGSIAAIMIAFVALIPVIRKNIPPSSTIVFIEMLVYANSLTSLFVLIDSVSVRNKKVYHFVWRQSGLFIVSCTIFVASIAIIFILMFLHFFYWKPCYKVGLKHQKEIKFKRKQWKNQLCDKYFKQMIQYKRKYELKPNENIEIQNIQQKSK